MRPWPSFLLIALSLLGGCGDPPPSLDGLGQPIPPPMPRERPAQDSLYDGEGVPLESEERVAGLVLPRGLDEVEGLRSGRRRTYTSRVPPQKLLRYFGPRLTTFDIRHEGEVVTYHEAIPRGVRSGAVKLDVTIRPSSAHPARVEIFERPPPSPPGAVITADEIRRHLDEQARHRE